MNIQPYMPALKLLAIAIVGAFWLYDRHSQYVAGKTACQLAYAEAQLKQVPAAIKKADTTRKEIEKADAEHTQNLVEIREVLIPCTPSNDELFLFNKAITKANARAGAAGKM